MTKTFNHMTAKEAELLIKKLQKNPQSDPGIRDQLSRLESLVGHLRQNLEDNFRKCCCGELKEDLYAVREGQLFLYSIYTKKEIDDIISSVYIQYPKGTKVYGVKAEYPIKGAKYDWFVEELDKAINIGDDLVKRYVVKK